MDYEKELLRSEGYAFEGHAVKVQKYLAGLKAEVLDYSRRTSSLSEAYKTVSAYTALTSRSLLLMRKAAIRGLPAEVPALRSVYWKILLGYLPMESSEWASVLGEKRNEYFWALERFVGKGFRGAIQPKSLQPGIKKEPGVMQNEPDLPCSCEPDSDCERTIDQITKDVLRTRTEVRLFTSALFEPNNPAASSKVTSIKALDLVHPSYFIHLLARVLYVYSRFQPSVRYVQGMNELLAPVFYVIFADPLTDDLEQKESDCFFCFCLLMHRHGQLELFRSELDNQTRGTMGRVKHLAEKLEKNDSELYNHLHSIDLKVEFFGLRWIMLLLTQEFDLAKTLRIWDAVLAEDPGSSNQDELIYYICLSILENLRNKLLGQNFSSCMKWLQKFPETLDPQKIIARAFKIRGKITNTTKPAAFQNGSMLSGIFSREQPCENPVLEYTRATFKFIRNWIDENK